MWSNAGVSPFFDRTFPRTYVGPLEVMLVKHVMPSITHVAFPTITHSKGSVEYSSFSIVFLFSVSLSVISRTLWLTRSCKWNLWGSSITFLLCCITEASFKCVLGRKGQGCGIGKRPLAFFTFLHWSDKCSRRVQAAIQSVFTMKLDEGGLT